MFILLLIAGDKAGEGTGCFNISGVYAGLGDRHNGLHYAQRAHEIFTAHLGASHPHTAMAQEAIAVLGGARAPLDHTSGPQPGTIQQLTHEEADAVDRLASMGFEKAAAAQAYLACDKNEMLAANLLMDGGFGS